VGGDDRVDVIGIDAGLLEVGDQPPHVLVALDRVAGRGTKLTDCQIWRLI
jgi:hypothetical protein